MMTVQERATHGISTGKISLNLQLHVFTVVGTVEPHVVRLFPSASCLCPATCQCYHVLAAKKTDCVARWGRPEKAH